jgi:M6 family metalloprotease-like protein
MIVWHAAACLKSAIKIKGFSSRPVVHVHTASANKGTVRAKQSPSPFLWYQNSVHPPCRRAYIKSPFKNLAKERSESRARPQPLMMIATWLENLKAAAVGIVLDASGDLVWTFLEDGSVIAISIADGSIKSTVQTVVSDLIRSVCALGEMKILALQANGDLMVLDVSDLTAAPTTLRVEGIADPGQMTTFDHDIESVFIVINDGHPDAVLLRVRISDASVTTEHQNKFLTAIATERGNSAKMYLASNNAQWGRGDLQILQDSVQYPWASDIPKTGRLSFAVLDRKILVVHPGLNFVSTVDLLDKQKITYTPLSLPLTLVEVQQLQDGRYLLLGLTGLVVVDALSEFGQHPYIEPPAPIFHASWGRVFFDLGTSHLDATSISFDVPDGPTAGFVSYTKEPGQNGPSPMLIGGGIPGTYKLVLQDKLGNAITQAPFSIIDHWPNDGDGPPGYYRGPALPDIGASDGPNFPQNLGTVQHLGVWKVLVLMMNTDTASWPSASLEEDRTAILQHVSAGFDDGSGVKRSAKQYYEENSGYSVSPAQGLTVSVHNDQVFGPVTMKNSWEDLFEQTKKDDNTITDKRWMSKGMSFESVILKAVRDKIVATADFKAVNLVIIVPASPDTSGGIGTRFCWPHARYINQYSVDTDATEEKHNLTQTWVPLDYKSHVGKFTYSTLCHEIGHTLDLPDLVALDYHSQAVKDRVTHDWEMMAGSRDTLPHFTISNKMREGWVPSSQIKLYDFSGSRSFNDTIRLEASSLESISDGAFKAIELRLGNGWNYYVEYRSVQPDFISDQISPTRQVVITDVTNDDFSAAIDRPPVLFVRNDGDGDGPLLDAGDDMEETDPGTQMDLRIEALDEQQDHARLKVVYGSNGRPEPGIRTWRGAATNWQSPDIEVRNTKSSADPARYGNMPWLGHENSVVAKVTNHGDLLAVDVRVNFTVLEYTSGHDGPEERLGFDTRDVPPGSTVEFTANERWVPPNTQNRHYCIIVRIRLYEDPVNPLIREQNIYDNEARSNYWTFNSETSSPASRAGTTVQLANLFDDPTEVSANISHTSVDHRIFTTAQYLRVGGKQSRPIQIWDEALLGTPQWNEERKKEPVYQFPNNISIKGYANVPYEADCKTPIATGGAGLSIFVGRATVIKVDHISQADVSGEVTFVDDGSPAGGKILVEMVPADVEDRREIIGEDLLNSGRFAFKYDRVPRRPRLKAIVVHFLGSVGASPSETDRIEVPL